MKNRGSVENRTDIPALPGGKRVDQTPPGTRAIGPETSELSDRVKDLRARIANGTYKVDNADVADRLIEDMLSRGRVDQPPPGSPRRVGDRSGTD